MPTITARLEDWLDEEIRGFWEAHGEGPSSGMREVAKEWWTTQNLPALEFRTGPAGRRAGIRNGPDVWEVVMVARERGRDPGELVDHFGGEIDRKSLDQALAYAERFPEEIDGRLEENRRMERLLREASGG